MPNKTKALTAASCGLILASSAAVPETASAASFLKFDGIENTASTNKAFKGYSEVDSFDWSITFVPSLIYSDVAWTQQIDAAIPELISRQLNGPPIDGANFSATDSAGTVYYQLAFTDVTLSSLSSSTSDTTTEVAGSFAYGAVEMTVFPIKPDGTKGTPVTTEWDITKNAPKFSSVVLQQLANLDAPVTVPIPATLPLFGAGAALLGLARRRRKPRTDCPD